MKRFITLITAFLFLLGFASCVGMTPNPTPSPTPSPTPTSAPSPSLSPTLSPTPTSALSPSPSPTPTPSPVLSEEELLAERIEEHLTNMTLREKIYQMFIITPEQLTGVSKITTAGEITKTKLQEYPVGGVIYFAKNLVSPEQTKTMLANTQAYSVEIENLPLFLCVDEEGGRVARIGNNPNFSAETIGPMATVTSVVEAYRCGNIIGDYLSELGFTVDFAPVADVITNPDNTVIGDRSFGTNADIVTEYAIAYSNGLHANHVLSTMKHFPGHGATKADTHEGYAYSDKTYEELLQAELRPFEAARNAGVDMIMVAHISLPNVVGDATPCSLSYKMITEILRTDLGYDGLVITDALNMGAIAKHYSPDRSAVMAVQAGVDLLLMPTDLNAAYSGIYNAIQNGTLSEDRIDESVRRILKAKFTMNEQ